MPGGKLKEVRTRIQSVISTQQITKAMKMVSAAKLRRAQEAIVQMRPYSNKLTEMLNNIIAGESSIELEYADTHSEQVLGLSGRDALEKDSGMLFIYDYPDTRCMWMKDMRFSLDMIWLDKDQKVLKIARSISPDTFPQTFCAGNAKYVIELNTGMADKLRYKVGDYIKL